MKIKLVLPLILMICAVPAMAQQTRQLDAHEHGVGELNIAFDGNQVVMELHVPGADIVGFEYEAESAEDRAAIDAAIALLARPQEIFVLPTAAECTVTHASAELESEDHDEHGEDDHEDHDEDEESHTEFHAEYLLTCSNPDAITGIEFAYFEWFENARELEVQIVTGSGASAFEIERDSPSLDLRGMF